MDPEGDQQRVQHLRDAERKQDWCDATVSVLLGLLARSEPERLESSEYQENPTQVKQMVQTQEEQEW